MEYIIFEKNNFKGSHIKRNYKTLLLRYFVIGFLLTILSFLCYCKIGNNLKKSNILKNQQITFLLEEEIPDLDLIRQNPHLQTEFILNLLSEPSKIDSTLFKNNHNKIKQKIYSIIENKDKNKDLYNILSTIYGAFLADSMGSGAESKPKDKNNHLLIYNEEGRFKPGQITDDSEMAMSQAYGIMDNGYYKALNNHLIYYYYVLWYKSNPIDIGPVTKAALQYLDLDQVNITDEIIFSDKIKDKISVKNSASLANGFIMRASPFLTWFYMLYKEYISGTLKTKSKENFFILYNKIYNEISKDVQLTHPNRENFVSASIFIFMGLCSMEHLSGKEILENTEILLQNIHFRNQANEEENKIKNHFENTLKEFSKENFEKDFFFNNLEEQSGLYLHAFNLTLYYLYTFDSQKEKMDLKDIYNNIVYDICDFGGDTETNSAIVGMIMGPLIGMENFDKKYFDIFLNYYSAERLIYTNVFMYFYANYLLEMANYPAYIENYNKVNFNFMEMILNMINNEIS